MRIVVFICITLIVFAFSNCKRETQCPAFDTADLKHIAYKNDDILIFKSHHYDKEKKYEIKISEINTTKSFNQKCPPDLYNQCPCENSAEVVATNFCNDESFVFLKMEQSDVSEVQNFKYNFFDFKFEIDFDNELKYANDIPFLDYYPILIIDEIIYTDVAVFTNLDNPNSEIFKVYLNKSKGIFQFEDKFHKVWKRDFYHEFEPLFEIPQ
jgi:hypothetical protein